MKQFIRVVLLMGILQIVVPQADSQVWPFRKKSQSEKATRKLKERQDQEGQSNAFNELQQMGSRQSSERLDYLWSSETAYSTQARNGNISLLSPSRLGLRNGLELSTLLPVNYWVPNLMVKKTHYNKKIVVATRHGLYSATPGLKWAQKKGYHTIVDSLVTVPTILTMKNELIVSKPFYNQASCAGEKPYLIITAAAGADIGFPFEKNDLTNIDEHILGSRSPALIGKGILFTGRLRADGQLTNNMFIEGGIKFFAGDLPNGFALEHHAGLQNFISQKFSFTLGYVLSLGNFSTSNLALFPAFDLSFYFGSKPGRPKGLFDRNMR